MTLKAILVFCFFFIPALSSAEMIKLNCVMSYDKSQHTYSIDTNKNLVRTNGGRPLEATITDSIISFIDNESPSGAIWSHLIQRQNGAMTIMDLKDKTLVLHLQCERVAGNKF